jgi:hypothetical protein
MATAHMEALGHFGDREKVLGHSVTCFSEDRQGPAVCPLLPTSATVDGVILRDHAAMPPSREVLSARGWLARRDYARRGKFVRFVRHHSGVCWCEGMIKKRKK